MIEAGGGGGGGGEDPVQEMLLTVWGGPTTHVPGGPSTSAGGKLLKMLELDTNWKSCHVRERSRTEGLELWEYVLDSGERALLCDVDTGRYGRDREDVVYVTEATGSVGAGIEDM